MNLSRLCRIGVLHEIGESYQFFHSSATDFFLVLPLVEESFRSKRIPKRECFDVLMSDILISEERSISRLFLNEMASNLKENVKRKYLENFGRQWREGKYLNTKHQTALHVLVKEGRKHLFDFFAAQHDIFPKEFYSHKDDEDQTIFDYAKKLGREKMTEALSKELEIEETTDAFSEDNQVRRNKSVLPIRPMG